MVINENNSHINSFTKGMNSDLAYDQLPNTNYTFGKNIRITKNQLIGDETGDYSSVHEGIITPVYAGYKVPGIEDEKWLKDLEILACDTVGNLGIIVTKEYEDAWRLNIHRFKLEQVRVQNGNTEILDDNITEFDENFLYVEDSRIENITQVSVVLYKELDNVIKLYIATGIWPILTIRVDESVTSNPNNATDVNSLINNRILPTDPVYIQATISGALKTSQVQYTYRFYNKYGIATRLAPLTNKIQVIDSNRNKETGNAEDTTTSVGFSLLIKNTDKDEIKKFERMLIYRIQYIKENEDANVYLIYDGDKQSQFNDVGIDPLQELTMEELASLSGIQIIPDVIEYNQDYMFAANVKDDTIITDIEIDTDPIGTEDQEHFINVVDTNVLISKPSGDYILPSTSNENFVRSGQDIKILKYDAEGSTSTGVTVYDYFEDRNIKTKDDNSNYYLVYNTYNNIFTSSLLRSLRRGETYKYGIVYYDNIGRRSDVLPIGDIYIPEINTYSDRGGCIFFNDDSKTYACPAGVEIRLPLPKKIGSDELVPNIVGCQIVRRSSKDIYQKTLLLVALARPIRQGLKKNTYADSWTQSPYYPSGFLTTDYAIIPGYYGWTGHSDVALYTRYEGVPEDFNTYGTLAPLKNFASSYNLENNYKNLGLFLIFSSEIDFRRDDILNKLSANDCYLNLTYILYPGESIEDLNNITYKLLNPSDDYRGLTFNKYTYTDGTNSIFIPKRELVEDTYKTVLGQCDKISDHIVYGYTVCENKKDNRLYKLIDVKDVKIPKWYEGFSNIKYNGTQLVVGVKQYKSYTTSIDEYIFNNWVSFGLYDLLIYDEYLPNTFRDYPDENKEWGTALFLYDEDPHSHAQGGKIGRNYTLTASYGNGFIGPGPSCLLAALDINNLYDIYGSKYEFSDILNIDDTRLGTYICNIQHDVSLMNAESNEVVQYFGFGNYFNLKLEGNEYKVVHNYKNDNDENIIDDYMIVFDGDIYITPHELTTEYKTYDFNSHDTLESMLVTNYVPMESKVNTFFDYGMNYSNTLSANLLYEAGSVEGIVTQDRPSHQYNMIYSMNDQSNDVFSLISTDKNETNNFPQRTYYSEPKINGEFIDNFNVFKAVSFIDVNSKYGEITNLLTNKNKLFYWQDTAFGKFSVNERSLINDQNGNTIMLGQAGILSRFDYINTKYGMRLYDFCATAAEDKVYWVDINNRAVVVGNANEAVNLGEQLNVQNIINKNIDVNKIPKTDYDLQNNEILFKCLKDNQLIVFNIKYNIATSIYNRDYSDIVYIDNHMYGINDKGLFTKYNYLSVEQNDGYLSPVQLSFVVNNAASTTKVFDSQLIVPIKRNEYSNSSAEDLEWFVGKFFDKDTTTEFETDILGVNSNTIEPHTDREGNIIYNVPRFGNNDWGNRMRGKWLRTSIDKETPHEFFTISHVITKLRQSYS